MTNLSREGEPTKAEYVTELQQMELLARVGKLIKDGILPPFILTQTINNLNNTATQEVRTGGAQDSFDQG